MAENKTKQNDDSVEDFINSIEDKKKKSDCLRIIELMKSATGAEPKMWGGSIIGFGNYHYKYASGREGDWFLTGVSPRKQNISIYIADGFAKYGDLLGKLGKHKTGVGCLYIKKLEDIDFDVLSALINESVTYKISNKSC